MSSIDALTIVVKIWAKTDGKGFFSCLISLDLLRFCQIFCLVLYIYLCCIYVISSSLSFSLELIIKSH